MNLIAYLKDSADKVDGNVYECSFLILYSEICQHLKNLHKLTNGYFLNDQCITLQGHSWVKEPFKV